jgi:hypothetical protein
MTRTYQREVSFLYPENWELQRETTPNGWSVQVQSPGTAFLLIDCDTSRPDPEEVIQTTLDALREDYPELDATRCEETVAGRQAVGHDIEFFSLDLVNSCWTRCLSTGEGTLLILGQVSDLEADRYAMVLKAICASLRVET